QRVLDARSNRLRPAVCPGRCAGRELEAELRRNDDPVTQWFERLADALLVVERAVDLRRVGKRDAALDGAADQREPLLPRRDRGEALAHAHAAEANRGDLEALSECACVHATEGSRRPPRVTGTGRTPHGTPAAG